MIFKGGQNVAARVEVPANRIWINTGVSAKKGHAIKFDATGTVCLAIHRLVDAAKDDRPRVGGWWIGPAGAAAQPNRPVDQWRAKGRIAPDSMPGTLLATIVGPDDADPTKPANYRPAKVFPVGANGRIPEGESSDGTIYLAVNDTILENTVESKLAYVATPQDLRQSYPEDAALQARSDADIIAQQELRWKAIVDSGYFNIWFDDNVGSYQVKITLK